MARVHVLHIPKTGGSALHAALTPLADTHGVTFHGHLMRLADIPRGEKVIFGIREPRTRFVSGFNSRLRKGLPLNNIEWSAVEKEGFAKFPTPNSLAEGLSDPNLDRRLSAVGLIRHSWHIGMPLSFWLTSEEYLAERKDDLLYVFRQEQLDDDFAALKTLLNLPAETALPSSPVTAHRTPPGFHTSLSDLATENLDWWYAADRRLYDAALQLSEEIAGLHAMAT